MSDEIPPHILLVDDHKMVAAGLARLLSGSYRVSIATDLAQMQQYLATHTFDLVMLDLQMSDGNPSKRYREVLTQHGAPILIVAATIGDAELFQCYADGVRGYAPKDLSEEDFTKVVRIVLQQESYWGAAIRQRLRLFEQSKPEVPKRLLPVIRHLLAAEAPEDQEIAIAENLSMRTVSNYISVLLQIFQVRDRHQLIKKLRQMGYTQDFLPE